MVNAISCWLKNNYLSQKTSPAKSPSTSNVIPTRRTQVQPVDPSAREPFTAAKYNHITTPWPPPQHLRFHTTPSSNAWWLRSCWGPRPLPTKRGVHPQSENIPASLVTSRNNIHPLKFKEVRQGQSQSMWFSVWQVKATSGQLISNRFIGIGLGSFIAAKIVRQIDVNDRVIWRQGCG